MNAPDSLWTERPQFVSGEFPSTHPGRVMIDCPLSDIDRLGVTIERQIRGKVWLGLFMFAAGQL